MISKEFNYSHVSVLLKESIEALKIRKDGIYVDCTTGGAGHSCEILKRLGANGLLICFDKDKTALSVAEKRLEEINSKAKFILVNDDFSEIESNLRNCGISKADGILADFGVSSHQLDENKRGFGYMQDGPLDMRMNPEEGISAMDVVNQYTREDLERILFEYGEERFARRIVKEIIKRRQDKNIKSTGELASIILSAMPRTSRREQQHPAKRTFQAIRIEVNNELESIKKLMSALPGVMADRSRFAAISFHSLEDRIVKDYIRKYENPCDCPKSIPVCVCNKKPLGISVTKKTITATSQEIEMNPRSRSARMRVFERIIQ